MAGTTKITYQSAQTAANEVRSHKTNLDDLIGGLNKTVRSLDGQFEGDAHNAFVNKWNEIEPKLKEFSATLEMFSNAIVSASSKLQEADTAGAKDFSQVGH